MPTQFYFRILQSNIELCSPKMLHETWRRLSALAQHTTNNRPNSTTINMITDCCLWPHGRSNDISVVCSDFMFIFLVVDVSSHVRKHFRFFALAYSVRTQYIRGNTKKTHTHMLAGLHRHKNAIASNSCTVLTRFRASRVYVF